MEGRVVLDEVLNRFPEWEVDYDNEVLDHTSTTRGLAAAPDHHVVTPKVAVVGAGFGGIAAGVKLKRAGIDTFTIYESSLGVGGTWWDNTYPGAEVDVGSHLYCFSFKPNDWTRTHAKQPELQKYLEETVDEFGLRTHLRLGVTVIRRRGTTTARWRSASKTGPSTSATCS